jgi:hypothetical protein
MTKWDLELVVQAVHRSGVTHEPVTPGQHGVTPSATSDVTFSNATVYISHATSCGVTQLLVASTKRATSWKFSWRGVSFKNLD